MVDAGRMFDDYHLSLYRYLVRFSGDADLAADAVQEAFLKLVQRPALEETFARAWLFKVATNVVIESTRARSRRARLLAAAPARTPVADPPRSPDDLVEADEQRRLVAEALGTLSDKERTALLMREEGFTHREIADVVGTTTGSVGTLIARALARLSDVLALDSEAL